VIDKDPITEPAEKLPVVWPWLALIGVLFAAAAGVMIAIVFSLMAEQQPESPVPTFEPTVSPTETPTEDPVTTTIVLLKDVFGKNINDASVFLRGKGLRV
jgi:hypothetical protein